MARAFFSAIEQETRHGGRGAGVGAASGAQAGRIPSRGVAGLFLVGNVGGRTRGKAQRKTASMADSE